MKNYLNPFAKVAPFGLTAIAVLAAGVAQAETEVAASPPITEEVVAARAARRQEIADMSDAERAAHREQRRAAVAERGEPSAEARQARRERAGNMSDADRQAMRDRMAERRAAGGQRPGGFGGPGRRGG